MPCKKQSWTTVTLPQCTCTCLCFVLVVACSFIQWLSYYLAWLCSLYH